MTATAATKNIPRGQDWTWTFTLEGSGSIAGATITANIRRRPSSQVLIRDAAMSITDAAGRGVALVLTPTQTLLLEGVATDPDAIVPHVLDVKLVLSGNTAVFGPLLFGARTPA